jgi:endoglucanase
MFPNLKAVALALFAIGLSFVTDAEPGTRTHDGQLASMTNAAMADSPTPTGVTGVVTGYSGTPTSGATGSTPFHYLQDTTSDHNVWNDRILRIGGPVPSVPFPQNAQTGGSGTLTGTPKSPLPPGFLHVSGNQIQAKNGNNVRLACSGYNIPTGLTRATFTSDMRIMRKQGFNCARYPMYDKEICPGGVCNFSVLDQLVAAAGATNMRLVLDHHGNEGDVCQGQQQNGLWYDLNGAAPWNVLLSNVDGCGNAGTVSYAQFKANLVAIATHYSGNATIIAFDMHNEPFQNTKYQRVVTNWGGKNGSDIHLMCEDAGSAVEAADPGVLIICEGLINYGPTFLNGTPFPAGGKTIMELTLASSIPVVLAGDTGSHVVYSVHEYPKSSGTIPHSGPAWVASRNTAWGFLVTNNIAPVWIGEAGASLDNGDGMLADERAWAETFRSYINGQQGALGGPTFTGCQQPIGQDWFAFGHLPSTWTLNGTLNADGSNKAAQEAIWSTFLYTTCRPERAKSPSDTEKH